MQCRICQSKYIKSLGFINGYIVNNNFEILNCQSCGVSYVSPNFIDEKIYEAIYKNIENVPGYSRYHQLANEIIGVKNPLSFLENHEEAYYGIIKSLRNNPNEKSNLKICEIGCGHGYLTYALVKGGYNAVGLDISNNAIVNARKKFGNYYFCEKISEYIKNNNKPTHIIASELIEHLPNPQDFILETLDSLGGECTLIFTTPKKPFKGEHIWDTELPPIHLWWFTEKSLRQLADNLNCEINFIDFTEFYKKNKRYQEALNNKSIKLSIFNENYELINYEKNHSNYDLLKKYSSNLILKFINKIIKRIILPTKIQARFVLY